MQRKVDGSAATEYLDEIVVCFAQYSMRMDLARPSGNQAVPKSRLTRPRRERTLGASSWKCCAVGEQSAILSLEEFLRGVFRCSAEVAQSIAKRAKEKPYPVKAVILKQGDRAAAAFLLMTGRAHALNFGLDGQLVLLREFLPGDFFGAIVGMESAPELADVVAAEPARTLIFLPVEFLGLIEAHACIGLALSRMLLKQLRAASTRMVVQTTLSSTGRVYTELLRLARLNDGRTIRPAPVLALLAVHAQCARETVSRKINALERRGMIRRDADALVILSPQRLEEMIL